MRKDINGCGDFVSWVEENYGTGKYDEFSPGELIFFEAYNWRKELIRMVDEEGMGYRKNEGVFEVSKKEYRKAIDKVNHMYDGYLGACIYNNLPACDFYNLITSMRMHGWEYECQKLCEELYFSAYDYYEGKMDEYEHYLKVMEDIEEGVSEVE